MTNTINGTRQLGDWEHQKFREDSSGKPAIAVVNADGSAVAGDALTDAELRATPVEVDVVNNVGTDPAQIEVLESIASSAQAIAHAKGIAADIRVTVVGGTVTTVTTVSTVSTVSNQTSMGGWTASSIVPATSNTTAVLANINNVGV